MVRNARRRPTCKMHQNAFLSVVPGRTLLTPWMQKKQLKHSKIRHKITTTKYEKRFCNGIHAVDRRAKMHRNAFICFYPGVALLTPWMQKSIKSQRSCPPRGGPIRSVVEFKIVIYVYNNGVNLIYNNLRTLNCRFRVLATPCRFSQTVRIEVQVLSPGSFDVSSVYRPRTAHFAPLFP